MGDLTEWWSDKCYNFLHFKNYPVRGFADQKVRSAYITRSHVAELVSSADGVNYSGEQAIQYVLGKKYALGRIKGENTIPGYMGHETITRAEVLQLIKNLTNHGMSNLYDRPAESSPEAKLPKLPTAWDLYRDNMYMVVFGEKSAKLYILRQKFGSVSPLLLNRMKKNLFYVTWLLTVLPPSKTFKHGLDLRGCGRR